MKQRPNCDREPLLPIRQIAHIVDKSIRKEKMVHAEVALVEKMMSYGWFRDIYNAASSFYATIMGNEGIAVVCLWNQDGSESREECYHFGHLKWHR